MFDLLTRFLVHSQKHFLEGENKLNGSELFCLIIATWLHDIGGMGVGISDKEFLSPDKARKEHPFNGGRIVLDDGKTVFLDLEDDEQDAIADIVVSHSSHVKLNNLQPKIVSGNRIETKVLAVLLSLADACDTQESRVGGFEEVKLKLHILEQLKNKLEEEIEKVEGQPSRDEEKLAELRADVEYISTQKGHHYKHLSVKNVFFTPTSIILEKSVLTLPEYEKYFNMALSDIQKEFDRVKGFITKYGIILQEVHRLRVSDNLEELYKQIKEKEVRGEKMGKALLITVGTGREEAKEKYAAWINDSIDIYNPNKVVFVVTEESKKETLPTVYNVVDLEDREHVERNLTDMDDIELVYEETTSFLNELIEEGFSVADIVVDFTGGRKPTSAGVAIAAALLEAGRLNYMAAKYDKGIPVPGTQRPISIKPYRILIDNKLKTVRELFNTHQFDACIEIIEGLKKLTEERDIQAKLTDYENRCLAYASWDKFEHEKAYELLMKIKGEYKENKEFLGRLLHSETKEPRHIADLMNNAERRFEEGKYDDAVARLYRVMELIAQYKLVKNYDIMTSDVDLNEIPAQLHEEYEKLRDDKGKIKIGLFKDYELLKEKGDELGKKFFGSKRLQDLLRSRNSSILAHGLEPVKEEVCEELFGITNGFANLIVKNLDGLKAKGEFPRL